VSLPRMRFHDPRSTKNGRGARGWSGIPKCGCGVSFTPCPLPRHFSYAGEFHTSAQRCVGVYMSVCVSAGACACMRVRACVRTCECVHAWVCECVYTFRYLRVPDFFVMFRIAQLTRTPRLHRLAGMHSAAWIIISSLVSRPTSLHSADTWVEWQPRTQPAEQRHAWIDMPSCLPTPSPAGCRIPSPSVRPCRAHQRHRSKIPW
jgi:hypothetical protein